MTTLGAVSARKQFVRPVGEATVGRAHGVLVFLLCSFPYVSFFRTPFDTQPFAVVGATVTVLFILGMQKTLPIPRQLVPFALVALFATSMLLVNSEIVTALRSLVGYASVFLVSLAAFLTFRFIRGSHFVAVVLTWMSFAFIQVTVDKEFGAYVLSRLETSEIRGVTSLAAEPSLYSVMCIYFLLLNDVFYVRRAYGKGTYLALMALIMAQVAMSRAGLGIVLLCGYLAARTLAQLRFGAMLKSLATSAAATTVIVGLFLWVPALQESRIGRLLAILFRDPWSILTADGSITDRLGHIIVSHCSLVHGPWLGYGLGNWSAHAGDLVATIGGFVHRLAAVNLTTGGGRIMSAWGSAIFELGVVGLLFVGAFVKLMYSGWKAASPDLRKVFVSGFLTMYLVMLMAVPIAFPLFGYMIGVFAFLQGAERPAVQLKQSIDKAVH